MQQDRLSRRFFALFFPLVLQNVITISVNLADNLMLGAYSEAALSGAAAVNQVQFLYQQLLFALGDGVVMFGSQFWGQHRRKPIAQVASRGLACGLGIALLLFGVVTFFPEGVLSLFTPDPVIRAQGLDYLKLIRWSYGFFAVTTLLLAALRSVETVKIAFRLSCMTLLVNCGINYALIYGHFGLPALGIRGAAIGTLTARVLECVVVIVYFLRFQKPIPLTLRKTEPGLTGRYLRKVVPLMALSGSWGLNVALQTVITGHMSSAAMSANSAASPLFLLAKSASVGACAATAALIGKAIGTGDLELVRQLSKRLQKLFVCIGITTAALLFFIRIPALRLYGLSPETEALADQFLLILCLVCATMSYQMPTNSGIIKGGGDVRFAVILDLVSTWLIVVPLSFFMAFWVKASPALVVLCLNIDQIFKCIPAFFHTRKGNWIRKLT